MRQIKVSNPRYAVLLLARETGYSQCCEAFPALTPLVSTQVWRGIFLISPAIHGWAQAIPILAPFEVGRQRAAEAKRRKEVVTPPEPEARRWPKWAAGSAAGVLSVSLLGYG